MITGLGKANHASEDFPYPPYADTGNLVWRPWFLNFPDSVISPSTRFLYRNQVFLVCFFCKYNPKSVPPQATGALLRRKEIPSTWFFINSISPASLLSTLFPSLLPRCHDSSFSPNCRTRTRPAGASNGVFGREPYTTGRLLGSVHRDPQCGARNAPLGAAIWRKAKTEDEWKGHLPVEPSPIMDHPCPVHSGLRASLTKVC